jgi:methionyl-tRNA formyltransferase
MKIVFMGTPDFAVPSLDILLSNGYEVAAVVTATDKLGGRGGNQVLQSDVKKYALSKGLPVLQPEKLKSKAFIAQLKDINADLFIVVAFRMLPEIIWSMPRLGTINVHGSLLPKYRGAAPINWAIINGEATSGVTTFKLSHEIDTGLIIGQKSTEILPQDNFGSVYERLKFIGADLLLETVHKIENNTATYLPQDETLVCHAPKIFYETCAIDFNQSGPVIVNFIRGLAPYPGAYFKFNELDMKVYKAEAIEEVHNHAIGSVITDHKKYLRIACKSGYVSLLDIKLEGKKQMGVQDFLNGYKFI